MASASKVFTIESLGEERYVQNVATRSNVTMNGIMYEDSIVSRIEIFKYCSDESERPIIFVQLYMGNVRLASWIQEEAVVLSEERHSPEENEQEGRLYGYRIRAQHDYEK